MVRFKLKLLQTYCQVYSAVLKQTDETEFQAAGILKRISTMT